ncbi:N-acetyltransferase family protein [Candidimonas sp. SYP-B2681]|uniref:GNAT family N-acetyltransferase n=1 Tax=Candidimonas sp. SYP-B2681 TaxID=2497686 RepID=UPI000F87C55A|nr:GNAT family N-acetyltransferase [Candidimonas sp. SYP-B2681]RTZ40683.1 N-acetyltransferase family protein [Candidimonas sp. SYP-B2681]
MTAANIAQVAGPAALSTAAQPRTALIIRDALPGDMADVQRIYTHHILHSTATFEEEPPTLDDMLARRANVLACGMPYLVAVLGTEVVGYCYASQYRPRIAYRYTIENSIYLDPRHSGQGYGKALLSALIERCEQGPWRQMIAVIAGTNNQGSIGLHRSMGFAHAGTQVATGFKFNQWIDVVFMQRALGAGSTTPPES